MNTTFENLLRRIGAYDRIRETLAYDCYQRLRYGRPIRWRHDEELFYRNIMGKHEDGLLVFDVGANRGQRTEVFLKLGARVIAIEPDPTSQRVLARRFSLQQPKGKRVIVIGKAASDADAAATLWVHSPGSGINSLSQKWVKSLGADNSRFGRRLVFVGLVVQTVTLDSLIKLYGIPHYIKIDVEGHEPAVLKGLGRSVPLLSFEVNLPEFLPEGIESVDILGRLDPSGRFNWFGGHPCSLGLPDWLAGPEFVAALKACKESSVEVLWKATQVAQGKKGHD